MHRLVGEFDWSRTPLGPPETWPAALRAVTQTLLAHPLAMIVLWGPDLVQVYNDPYRVIMAGKHPAGLGQPTRDCWPEVWDFNAPLYERVLDRGEALSFTDQRLVIQRHGMDEEAFFTLTYSPVYDDAGAVGGVLVTVIETTEHVRAQARVRERTAEVEQRNEALDAFVAFTEQVDGQTELPALVDHAAAVLSASLGELSVVYSELVGGLWRAQAWSSDVSPEFVARLRAGFVPEVPRFAQAIRGRQAHFAHDWRPTDERLPDTRRYRAVATYPYFQDDAPRGMLSVALTQRRGWSEREQAVVRAVGRSLGLALERAQAQQEARERAEQIQADARAQEAFVAYTETVGTETDVPTLAQRAVDVLQTQFPQGTGGYYECERGGGGGGERWVLRTWTRDLDDQRDFIAVLRAGLPSETPFIAELLRSGGPVFFETWDAGRQGVPHSEGYGTVAAYPVMLGGEVRGFFSLGLRHTSRWSLRERGVFRAVGHGLTLALERAEQAQQLQAQNAELDARTRALEAFGEWTRDLALEAAPEALIGRAQELLLGLLGVQTALYYEREGDFWHVGSMRGEYGSEGLRRLHEAGLAHDTTPNLRRPFESGESDYQDTYVPSSSAVAEHSGHVRATAIVPLRGAHGVRGLLGVANFEHTHWTKPERAIIETVRRSLELALDRADRLAELAQERAALRERTAELAAANGELEAFAYSVSHDLRAPVRHILGFHDLLRRQLAGTLDPKAERYLAVVGESAERMNILIDAMLDLSRSGRATLKLRPVDLNTLVRLVRAELDSDVGSRQVTWQVGPLPTVTADLDTLRQVVSNLLSNALKYTRTREEARIEVWAEERPGEVAVFVRDNGVGYDPQYGGKLFGVFQRLHHTKDFEGTGVGLANVRRIIQRHGGRAWAEGQLGQGATFAFTLPQPT